MIDIEKIKQAIQDGFPVHPDDILGLITRLEATEKDAELWKEHALMLGSQTDGAVKELREYVEVLEAKLASIENKGE